MNPTRLPRSGGPRGPRGPRGLSGSAGALALAGVAVLGVLAAPGSPLSAAPPGRAPLRLLVRGPADAVVGEAIGLSVLVLDEVGPEGPVLPDAGVREDVELELWADGPVAADGSTAADALELPHRIVVPRESRGRARFEVRPRSPGSFRVQVRAIRDGESTTAPSAPIRVHATPPVERVFWGDLHAHLHTPGAGHAGVLDPLELAERLEEGLAFGRDVMSLDFAAFTPHVQTAGGLARERSGRSPWGEVLRVVERANAPGRFVVFPGFEWQGNEGDHCVIYPAARELEAPADFLALAESVKRTGALLTAHAVFLPTEFDPRTGALAAIEVARDTRTVDDFAARALRAGVVLPFLGCSDTHGGAIGATSLTGVRAERLDRESILAAIRSGRCWATSGERIIVGLTVDTLRGRPRLVVTGTATAPVDVIEFFRDGIAIGEVRDFGEALEFSAVLEDTEVPSDGRPGAPAVAYHARVVQTSYGVFDPGRRTVAVTSPVSVRLGPASRAEDDRGIEVGRAAAGRPLEIPVRAEGDRVLEIPVRESISVRALPVDPRHLARLEPPTLRDVELLREMDFRWGFTKLRDAESLPAPPGLSDARVQLEVRVRDPGGRRGRATVSGGLHPVRLEETAAGWSGSLAREELPAAGGPLTLALEPPGFVESVILRGSRPGMLPRLGEVTSLEHHPGPAGEDRLVARVRGAPVDVSIDLAGLRPGDPPGPALASARELAPGANALALAAVRDGARGIVVRWGFAGWTRVSGVELEGHDVARARGFAALPDGRAVVALEDRVLIVDLVAGSPESAQRRAARELPWPDGKRMGEGREFCVAHLARDRVLVRGASWPEGGWAAELDLRTLAWEPVAAGPGPEDGTVAAHPGGGYAWLTGRTLRRRDASGRALPPLVGVPAGRLLGFEPSGRPVIRTGSGHVVRVDPAAGEIVASLEATVIALEPSGAVLVLDGLGARHAELARSVRISRWLADGTRAAPWSVGVKTSPVLDPPILGAIAADGSLLVLGGATWWRREPGHDWWGAVVERWAPVWAGETALPIAAEPTSVPER